MPRVCSFTGRRTSSGNTYTHRGKAKYLGGVGTKVTGKTRRRFRPNLRRVTAVVDGAVQRVTVSTKAMKMGLVVKPLKRKFVVRQMAEAQAQGQIEAQQAGTSES
ncbi:MAG: 50S ribosomal protein L28 [Phycisphaeraceae bacterium]|nr:50S ribosomal protein L28 [Phycisphaeraceae bacterium]